MARPIYPDREVIERVRALVEQSSLAGASRQLRMAEATVARLAGGLKVTEGTAAVAVQRLSKIPRAAA
jgi:hypothetical protein